MHASSPRAIGRIAGAIAFALFGTIAATTATAQGGVPLQPRPDLCAIAEVSLPVTSTALPGVGKALRYYLTDQTAPPANPADPWSPKVVLIVNGNTFPLSSYTAYAEFLARQGFLPIVVERTNNTSFATSIVKQALDAVFADLDLPHDTPVALVGHSRGGGVVVNGAVANAAAADPYKVKAVVSLAPNATDVDALTPAATSDFLVIYGSQDEDMAGTAGAPHEGFALYDRAGTEGSTTCTDAICFALPGQPQPMERTMIYIHGADHPGMIGKAVGIANIEDEFIHFSDQGCLSRSYVGGFLRWKMMGESHFKGMLRDEWRATTASSIVSSQPDYMGNAAGSPLRMAFQVSPRHRRVVENFEDGTWASTIVSPAMQFVVTTEGQFATSPAFIRHETRALIAGWTNAPAWQTFAVDVPVGSRDTTHFSDLAVRVGLFRGASASFKHPANTDGELWIGLSDGNALTWEALQSWGTIFRNDAKAGSGNAHSAMNTIAVPLGAFETVDRTNVERIYFTVKPNSRGSVLLDNIEFWKD